MSPNKCLQGVRKGQWQPVSPARPLQIELYHLQYATCHAFCSAQSGQARMLENEGRQPRSLAGLMVVQHWCRPAGDLPDTVRSIHEEGYLSVSKAPSMFLCSALCIAAGGSLGPEAPLLALCGSSCSWVGR